MRGWRGVLERPPGNARPFKFIPNVGPSCAAGSTPRRWGGGRGVGAVAGPVLYCLGRSGAPSVFHVFTVRGAAPGLARAGPRIRAQLAGRKVALSGRRPTVGRVQLLQQLLQRAGVRAAPSSPLVASQGRAPLGARVGTAWGAGVGRATGGREPRVLVGQRPLMGLVCVNWWVPSLHTPKRNGGRKRSCRVAVVEPGGTHQRGASPAGRRLVGAARERGRATVPGAVSRRPSPRPARGSPGSTHQAETGIGSSCRHLSSFTPVQLQNRPASPAENRQNFQLTVRQRELKRPKPHASRRAAAANSAS
jgi:hypothetical protein